MPNNEQFVSEALMRIGVPCHIKGFNFLKTAILLVITNPELIYAMTKELYPQVASTFNTTDKRIERGIRHAIETAWNKGLFDALENVLGPGVTEEKMTNSQFIATFVERMRTDMMLKAS